MTRITIKLTAKELELVSRLVADQLFNREFVDSRLHGNKTDPAELTLGKQLVERFRALTRAEQTSPPLPRRSGASV